jgi:hypothetical protein
VLVWVGIWRDGRMLLVAAAIGLQQGARRVLEGC